MKKIINRNAKKHDLKYAEKFNTVFYFALFFVRFFQILICSI